MRKKNIDIYNDLSTDMQDEILKKMHQYLNSDTITLNELAATCNSLSGMNCNRISLRRLMDEIGVGGKSIDSITQARKIKTIQHNKSSKKIKYDEIETYILRKYNRNDLIEKSKNTPKKTLAREIGITVYHLNKILEQWSN